MHQLRDGYVATSGAGAHAALSRHLGEVLSTLQPERLGLYWPLRSEFNAAQACGEDVDLVGVAFALPYARKSPRELHYRAWDRCEPKARDELNIPCAEGSPVLPDVVLVPCLGFTADGYRLGYGGGYYDRWLAANPHVTAVGLAWSATELTLAQLAVEPHDQALMLVVTELGVVGG